MKKYLTIMTVLSLSASAFANIYECGPLKYRGKPTIGGMRYEVETVKSKVFLYSRVTPSAPGSTPNKVEMKSTSGGGEMMKFSAGDLDAVLIYNIRSRQTDVTLEKATNHDWSTSCLLQTKM